MTEAAPVPDITISQTRRVRETAVLVAGLAFLALVLAGPRLLDWGPSAERREWTFVVSLHCASDMLVGGRTPVDVATDIVGLRALVAGKDPYPLLGPALLENGIDWRVNHESTHPPGAYLITFPVAFLPIRIAMAAWAWLMLSGIAASLFLLGLPWRCAVGLAPLSLLWPPAAHSLGQLTVLILLAVAVAMRGGERSSAIAIGIASIVKLVPGVLLVPFLLARKWRVAAGVAAVWVVSSLVLLALDAGVFARYLEVNRRNAPAVMEREDNASAVLAPFHQLGVAGGALSGAVLLAVLVVHRSRKGRDAVLTFSYLSVALLPIAWIYSSLPLLPVYASFLRGRRIPAQALALLSFALLLVPPPFGEDSALLISSSTLLLGVALSIDRWDPPLHRS